MAREKRKERLTRLREEQILQAALEVFSEKGFGAATIPAIASRAGLAVGSIYNYFPNKRELFVAVIRHFILNIPLMNLIDDLPNGDFPKVLAKILQNRLLLLDSPEIAYIPFLMAEVQRDPGLKELWREELLHPLTDKLENVYRVLGKTGNYRDIDPAITVRLIGGALLGFLMFRIMEGEKSPLHDLPGETITSAMADFLLYGLKWHTNNDERPEQQ